MKTFLRFALLIALSLPLEADLKSNGIPIDTIDTVALGINNGIAGDTYLFTSWTGTETGGKFNGGHIYGSANDGSGCSTSFNLAVLELTVLDWDNKTKTHVECANTMSSFGHTGQGNVPAGWNSIAWKNFNPFSVAGVLYLPVERQEQSSPWRVDMSTVIMSPDRAQHWCNPATLAAGGGTCTSSNWSATGDAPPNPTTGMMWGSLGVWSNPMARIANVQFCQDQTCTGMPFDADNYLYFITNNGLITKSYAACVAKSQAAIMDVTQWWYKKADGNGTCGDTNYWSHTVTDAIPVRQVSYASSATNENPRGPAPNGMIVSVMWVAGAGQFVATGNTRTYNGTNTTIFYTSQYPWGPWNRIFIGPTSSDIGFQATNLAFLDSSCAGCGSGRYQLTYAHDSYAHLPAASLYFDKVWLITSGPGTPNTLQSGRMRLGRLPLAGSNHGEGNSLILNGLIKLYTLDEALDWSPSALPTYASTVTRNLVGTYPSDCITAGSNPPGYMSWGSQGSTAGIAYLVGGITLGGYASQFNSGMGACSGYLPLSGDAAWTVQLIWTPTSVTGTREGIFELGATSSFANHQQAIVHTNQNGGGGTKIGYLELGGGLLEATLPWTAGNTYLLTITKQSGVNYLSGVKIYLGKTNYPGTVTTSDDGALTNYPSTMHLVAGCSENPISRCDNGTLQNAVASGTWSFLGLYNRVLSADEVAHNYMALKAAMAKRGVTVQ